MTRSEPPSPHSQSNDGSGGQNPSQVSSTLPRYSVGNCPICECGLCTIRAFGSEGKPPTHGLIICDECEAIWLQPDLGGVHVYTNPETPTCPISGEPLYQGTSHWASRQDIEHLGWSAAVDPELTVSTEETREA